MSAAEVVFLACTELPLLLPKVAGVAAAEQWLGGKRVVDVTAMLASRLTELGSSQPEVVSGGGG